MKLFTKGLLLIAIPGVVELALLGDVFSTQKEAVLAAHRAGNSKQILWQASSLADPLLREAARVRTGIALSDPSFIDRRAVWTEFSDRLAELARMVADNPDQLARVERMRAAAYAWRIQATNIADALRAGRSIANASSFGNALPPEIETVRNELGQFLAEEERLDAARSLSSSRTRRRQRDALTFAVVGSMLIWAASAAVFSRGIGRRLATLGENARRLGEGGALAAPLSGNDEIATLDAVLHQTSRRLREAGREQATLRAQLQARAADLARANEHLRHETQDNEMFIYSVSHDLRSPLVNLQGFSKELEVSCNDLRAAVAAAGLPEGLRQRMTEVLDGDVSESLGFLRQAVARAAAIIDALLRLSRAGRVEYRWQRVSVSRIVGRVVDALRDEAGARNVQINVHELPPAWGDPAALEQVFSSLVDNALRHLDPARPGYVEIGALDAAASPAGSSAGSPAGLSAGLPDIPAAPGSDATTARTYYVRDNGTGIPAVYVPKLFRAFQRLHGDDARGQGIGLALVHRIVERLGGRVWVESVEGAGSTFFVTLSGQPQRA